MSCRGVRRVDVGDGTGPERVAEARADAGAGADTREARRKGADASRRAKGARTKRLPHCHPKGQTRKEIHETRSRRSVRGEGGGRGGEAEAAENKKKYARVPRRRGGAGPKEDASGGGEEVKDAKTDRSG